MRHIFPFFNFFWCIYNNIFWKNIWSGGDIIGSGSYTESNNLFNTVPLFINGDPESVDPYDPNNYKLSQTSPAIDAGADLSGIVDIDFFGTARPQGNGYDIGAYEYD